MRHLLKPLCLGLAASVAITACGEDPPPEEPVSCPCSCTAADPVAHCVNTQDCESTADCPTGTVCAPLPPSLEVFPEAQGSDPLASCGSSSPSKRCQLPLSQVGRQALNTGFEVPVFGLFRVDSTGYAALSWNPPEGTHIVHCALFSCPPVISESVRDDRRFFHIDNYASCVMAAKVYEPGEGVFDLGDASLAFTPAPRVAPGCGVSSPRVVHSLMAGCWAYDKTEIIAATPLEPVSPAETFNFGDRFDLDCSSGVDGRTCTLPAQPSLGICTQGVCRRPCVTRQDCEHDGAPVAADAGAADAGDAGTEESADPICFKSGGYVGVCLPPGATMKEVSP